MQCMFIIVLAKSFLSLAAKPALVFVISEGLSNTKASKFYISMASFWEVLVRHVTIASTSGEATSECYKISKQSRNAVSVFPLSTSRNFTKDLSSVSMTQKLDFFMLLTRF